jgi:hypothetical protein
MVDENRMAPGKPIATPDAENAMTTRSRINPESGRATDGMGGRGFYDDHSEGQREGIRRQEARLRSAARNVDVSGPELRVMDYGSGPGRNSMAVVRTLIDELRGRNGTVPMVAVHNDQIGNDWSGLVANLRGPESYLRDTDNIRTEIAIGSFFDRVAGAGTVDLGTCFGAAHWLSRSVRVPSPGSLFFCDLPEPARGDVAAMADRDWTDFLRQRARELRPGGRLVIDMLATVRDPDDPSGVRAAGCRLYRAFWQVAASMAEEGRIDRTLLDGFVFPVYFRSTDEVCGPIGREDDLSARLEIVEMENERLPNPYEDDLQRTGDVAAYAAAYAGFARAFAESTLRSQLFRESSSDAAEAGALADAFFRRLQALFAAEPGLHAFDHQVLTIVLGRRREVP